MSVIFIKENYIYFDALFFFTYNEQVIMYICFLLCIVTYQLYFSSIPLSSNMFEYVFPKIFKQLSLIIQRNTQCEKMIIQYLLVSFVKIPLLNILLKLMSTTILSKHIFNYS